MALGWDPQGLRRETSSLEVGRRWGTRGGGTDEGCSILPLHSFYICIYIQACRYHDLKVDADSGLCRLEDSGPDDCVQQHHNEARLFGPRGRNRFRETTGSAVVPLGGRWVPLR